jgi:serine protease Do
MRNNLLFLSVLFVMATCFYAEGEQTVQIYSLPLYEAERVILEWLLGNGFDVSRTAKENGNVELTGSNEREIWVITLKPHSVLSSAVSGEYRKDGVYDRTRVTDLWAYLDRYIRTPDSGEKTYDRTIPESILSQSESVVCIRAAKTDGDLQLSGFFIDTEGVIVSTAHDLDDVQDISVILKNGQAHKGRLLHYDSRRDLALIDIGQKVTSAVSLKRVRDTLRTKETVYAIGCPGNRPGIIHEGDIDGPEKRVFDLPIWEVNMEVLPGSSGSPVFDTRGNLVGIIKGRHRKNDAKGFLIPVESLKSFLKGE